MIYFGIMYTWKFMVEFIYTVSDQSQNSIELSNVKKTQGE